MLPKVIFVGGGHAHVLALRRLCGRLPADVRPVLVSAQSQTPYSGMLPGYVSGVYKRHECFINLRRVAEKFDFDLIESPAVRVDADNHLLSLADGQKLYYDVLSLNLGGNISPPFTGEGMCLVKPIDDFMSWLESLDVGTPLDVVVVGAGAGGVEIALAIDSRRRAAGKKPHRISLVGYTFMANYPAAACHRLKAEMATRGIKIVDGACAVERLPGELLLDDNSRLAADKVVFATPVSAPDWLADSALALSKKGFVAVDPCLQSMSHAKVFASGDCADHVAGKQAKSGVLAVRQAPLLANNILAAVQNRPLQSWRAPQTTLSIIDTGKGNAVAAYGSITVCGRWVWYWKKHLDKKFMDKFK